MRNTGKTMKIFGAAGGLFSRQKPRCQCCALARGLMAALVCTAAFSASAQDSGPAINELELQASQRGLVLIITAAGPITVGNAADLEKNTAKYAKTSVRVPLARSGLSAANFDAPAEIPVKSIALKEVAGGGTDIALTMRQTVNGPVMVRGENNQVRILLTKDAQPEIRWTASKGLIWSKAASPADPAAQGNIRVEPPDMQKMEARASKDTNPAPPNKMFTVKEGGAPNALSRKTEIPAAMPDEIYHDSGAAQVDTGLVRYRVLGRDPFVPLEKDTSNWADLPRVENLRLVGVLEDTHERIALLEDFTDGNRAFALRVSDPVEHGKVLRVHRDKVVFIIRDFDVSRSYTLSLTKNNAQGGRARGR